MRGKTWLLLSSAFLVLAVGLLVGCGGGSSEPSEIADSRLMLDQSWEQGVNAQRVILELGRNTPGVGYISAKLDEVLAGTNRDLKLAAINLLVDWKDPQATAKITPLLQDSDELVKIAAAKALAKQGDPAGLEIIAGRILDGQQRLVPENCGLLAKLGDERCFDHVMKGLTDEDAPASAAAAAALGEMGGPKSIDLLRAAFGIDKIREERRNPVIAALALISKEERDAKKIGSYVKNSENVLSAITALGDIGGEYAEKKLRATLGKAEKKNDLYGGAAAAGALLNMGVQDEEILDVLSRALDSESEKVRYTAATGLADATMSPEVKTLLMKAAESDGNSSNVAMEVLVKGADASLRPLFESVFNRFKGEQDAGPANAAVLAVVGISRLPAEDVDTFLATTTQDMDATLNVAIQAALSMMKRHEDAQAAKGA